MPSCLKLLSLLPLCTLLSPVAALAGPQATDPGPSAAVSAATAAISSWLEDVALLITPREREAYLALGDEGSRGAFVRSFWDVRDPYPQTARNEAKERWRDLLAEARARFGGLDDPRARALLLAGEPDRAFTGSCPGGPAIEVWFYQRTPRLDSKLPLFFLADPAGGPPRLFVRGGSPGDADRRRDDLAAPAVSADSDTTLEGITRDAGPGCAPHADMANMRMWMRLIGGSYDSMVGRALSPPPPPSDDWLVTFDPVSTEVASGAPALDGDLYVAFPGRAADGAAGLAGNTILRGVITVPAEEPPSAAAPARRGAVRRVRDFLLTGQVLRSRQILETFRYVFRVADPERPGARLPIAFERQLPPGQYTLVVRLQDLEEGSFFRGEREVDVPAEPAADLDVDTDADTDAGTSQTAGAHPAAGPTGSEAVGFPAPVSSVPTAEVGSLSPSPEFASLPPPATADPFAEATSGMAEDSGPSVHLLAPAGQFLTGEVRFEARATPEVARVAFLLDGERLLTRNRPPFEVRLDLGPAPRPHTVEAEGLDASGRRIAGDRLEVNAGAQRFAVALLEPRPERSYERSLRAVARVSLPPGRSLDRLELFWNETRLATLYQPPWTLPVALPAPGAVGYLRAVAYLPDGASAEALARVNVEGYGTEVEVRLVELYATVVDRGGRPVDGLAGGQFRVMEDGIPQAVRRFEKVRDLPLAAGLLLDTSASMGPVLAEVRAAAQAFLGTLTPRDRAALLTFDTNPRLEVPLTGDRAALERGLTTLVAQRETALHDSVVFGLRALAGAPGQRALLLLSDGEERGSAFGFDQALEVARRSGVTLYVLGLGAKRGDARNRLARLAEETGGRAFFPREAAELAGIYAEIGRELRSRYLLAYESSQGGTGRDFRRVEVALSPPGLEARTINGYYP